MPAPKVKITLDRADMARLTSDITAKAHAGHRAVMAAISQPCGHTEQELIFKAAAAYRRASRGDSIPSDLRTTVRKALAACGQ